MIALPIEINHIRPNYEGFAFQKGTNRIEATFESGETFIKKTTRKTPDRFSFNLEFSESEYRVFQDFYDNTLDQGIEKFSWRHPLNDSMIICKFIGQIVVSAVVGNRFSIFLTCEIVDEL